MTVTSTTGGQSAFAAANATAAATRTKSAAKGAMSSLDQGDFLKLMTVQMQQQDPFNPTDQKEMLAQMAQFSSLAGIGEVNDTLRTIAGKLDAVLSAQAAASAGAATTSTQEN